MSRLPLLVTSVERGGRVVARIWIGRRRSCVGGVQHGARLGKVATIVIVALWPLVIVPRVHVTVVVPEQVPSDVAEETNVTPAGNASVIATFAALIGPLFVTVIV